MNNTTPASDRRRTSQAPAPVSRVHTQLEAIVAKACGFQPVYTRDDPRTAPWKGKVSK